MTDKSTEFLKSIIEVSLHSCEDEISCEACEEALDQYVDLLESGGDPKLIMPALEQHLAVCPCCHSEYEALLIAVIAATENE